MKLSRSLTLTAAAALVAPLSAFGMVIVDEDFESYADTTDLGGTWSLGDGTLDTVLGNPGNSLSHPGTGGSFSGANTNSITFAPVYPGAGETLIFSAQIYDDDNSQAERNTAGLRTAAGANIIEMGHYNSPSHYAIRTVLFGAGSDGSWVAFDNIQSDAGDAIDQGISVEGWHTYTAEITDSQVTFTLDLGSTGIINATHVAAITQNAANGFDQIRLGGPSDLGSLPGGANFDNVKLELVIPEPGTAALASLGGLCLLRRRRA
ncbi:MAG: PEP-CTERM sorting domain-containing protein [Planctomycetota bacterium]